MFESIVAVWTNVNTSPCGVVFEEIDLMTSIEDLRRTLIETSSESVVDEFVC